MTQESQTMTIPDKKLKVAKITIRLTYQEAPIDIELEDATTADVERAVSGLLRREGWKPAKPPAAMGMGFGPRKPQTPPFYDGDGNVCCPVHHTPLKKLEFSSVCSTKLLQGDPQANDRGYCKYTYREGK